MSDVCENASIQGYHPRPATRPNGAAAQLVMFYIENALLVLFVLVFLGFKYLHPRRNRFSRLKQRSTLFLVAVHLGASLATVTGSWYQAHDPEDGMPCVVFVLAYFSVIPLLVLPIATRLITFYREAQWAYVIYGATTSGKMVSGKDELHHGENLSQVESETTSRKTFAPMREFWYAMVLSFFYQKDIHRSQHARTKTVHTQGEDLEVATSPLGRSAPELYAMRFLKSGRGTIATLAVMILPFLLVSIVTAATNPFVAQGCWGCDPNSVYQGLFIAQGIVALVLLIVTYRINLGKKDPFGILSEIRYVVWVAGLPALLLVILGAALRTQLQGDFQFSMILEWCLVIGCFIQSVLQCILAVADLRRDQRAVQQTAYTIKEFEQDFVRKTGPYHEAFSRHLLFEHGFESLAFLSSAFNWEKEYFDVNPKTARARAKKIMNMHVGENAELPCNLSENCVNQLQRQLDKLDDELKYDFFGMAKGELLKMLYSDSFLRFLRSAEYRTLANTLREQAAETRDTIAMSVRPH